MSKPTDFQASMEQLEKIVNQLEQSKNSLEESLARYEEGMKLVAQCEKTLVSAKQRVFEVSKNEAGIEVKTLQQRETETDEYADKNKA